ncbi:hypothetical protein F5Y04DRAFT_274826 [Hypomontagnella monticulosa]|nr:hypothetical protein F5Y04DRAFT_274826 [Hypomontagnella monticulosa]
MATMKMARARLVKTQDPVPNDDSDSRQTFCKSKPKWASLINLINQHMVVAARTKRKDGRKRTLKEHKRFYKAKFQRIKSEAITRNDIPRAVMKPPVGTVTLVFRGVSNGRGPPHHTGQEFRIEVRARDGEPDGVTKGDLIDHIGAFFYEGLHHVHVSSGEVGVVPSSFTWMNTGGFPQPRDNNVLYIGYTAAAVHPSKENSAADEEKEEEIRETMQDPFKSFLVMEIEKMQLDQRNAEYHSLPDVE